ncbi:MAG: hypothetical protein LBB41_03160 [Prevotellaceae bacterium]|jgi:hypothetical protein|nr:hypothetical protein [Prevotellaceae bacterium]
MKNIKFFSLITIIIALALAACAPQEFDKYSLGDGTNFTEDQVIFTLTQDADQWTYSYTATVNINSPHAALIDFGDGKGSTKQLTGTYEYIVEAGTYTAKLYVYNPNGQILEKSFAVTITETNPKFYQDDPASVQYALTGGRDNVEGKVWTLRQGATGLGPATGTWGEWWQIDSPNLFDDEFTFKPNSVQPNGAFIYDNKGATFCNESLAALFPDGDPAGSFVTVNYTPPTDAAWTVETRDGKNYLKLAKGFIGYPVQPADLDATEYEVVEYSPVEIKLKYYSPDGNAWFFFLGSEVEENPLYGITGKAWKIDGYNTKAAEIAAATGLRVSGFMGLGGSYSQEWWGAGAGDKSYETTETAGHAWTLYDWRFTFTASGIDITVGSTGEGYGRKAYDGNPFTSTGIDGDDMYFVYGGGSYTYTRDNSATPYPKLTISGDGFMGYYTGTNEYEILYLADDAMCLLSHNAVEGHDWIFVYIPAE